MGQEISASEFSADDVARFEQALRAETALARELFARHGYAPRTRMAGFELEAWLLDHNGFPKPCNQSFLARMADPLVVPELSRFNIELNGTPRPLQGAALSLLETELANTWARCLANAQADEATVVAIGTLPTLREADLDLASMTPARRYLALNQQVLAARGGRPLRLRIAPGQATDDAARGALDTSHADVMLEAATTSFQVHLQVPAAQVARHLNASMILSAPLVALAANAPFLFGRALWHETRIPLFEQAVDCGEGSDDSDGAGLPHDLGRTDLAHLGRRRVSFGSGYVGTDPTELFADNLARYPVLLPLVSEEPPQRFAHLRLHNGTLWRWNRLLIGFEPDGRPHLRIEQRVMPAGPSVADMIANAAFYYGCAHMLATAAQPPEAQLPFDAARRNFYLAARDGLGATIRWLDGRDHPVTEVLAELLAQAREGLARLDIDTADRERSLDLLAARLRTRRNGAAWQLAHHARHHDFFHLTADYLAHQRSGRPVHEWPL
ncbi:glutamate-cysteine ligase family protein [Sphaerotilus microaerophilus]|uniref:Glutamate--cysteine ligase n=1 Tax=Sphaerotilus microaerophilus TaxID=2914710 RepID=A0ABM7YSU1_9BURK|nr:glutamate-cysteine ligase family protein [Sphaerotilus sp. FB-5]BDI07625.1 hypothetical protein CATMQ487_45950 [Sphaerotilus sp. FB-5]